MIPRLSLAADLELRQAQLQAQQLLRDDPERLRGLLFGLMSSHLHQREMINGALARVIQLKTELALAQHTLQRRVEAK